MQPVLITALCQGQRHHALVQVATFAPHNANTHELAVIAEMDDHCIARQCTWWVRAQHVDHDEQVPIRSGSGIELVVHDGDFRAAEHVHIPILAWPQPQPPPPGRDPEPIFVDSDDENAISPTNSQSGLNDHSVWPQAEEAGTFSPTNRNTNLGEDVTRQPFGSASSSLDEETMISQLLPPANGTDHEDIDDEITLMAINLAREQDDPQGPLTDDHQIARNIDSPEDLDMDYEDGYDEGSEEHHEEIEEEHTPVQRREPEPPCYASIIYMINSPAVRAHLPFGNRNRFYVATAEALQVPLGQLVYLYAIPHAPEDIAEARTTPMIAQLTGEVPPGSIHRYVLIDIEFHAELPTLTPEVDRSARLLPKQLTRFQILRVMGVASYCIRTHHQPQQCLLWINNCLISGDDRSLQNLRHGDYIKIALPPDSKTAEHFSTREMAQICWTGREALAEFGHEGRPYLPAHLPEVPPEASIIYAMPPVVIQIEDDDDPSLLQKDANIKLHEVEMAHPAVLTDITNHQLEEVTCPGDGKRHRPHRQFESAPPTSRSTRSSTHDDLPLFEQELRRIALSIFQSRRALPSGDLMVHTWYIDHVRYVKQHWDRLVMLGPDATQWRRLILAAWSDVVPQMTLHIFTW